MADELNTTLDYIDKIIVDGNPFTEPTNEYYALLCLRSGLDFLYHQAKKCDQIALQKLDPKKQYGGYVEGLLPEPTMRLIACAFQWYSVSACQYVKTVGVISYRQDLIRQTPDEYVDKIIPEVKVFRDKVGAHYSWGTKHKEDNEAERLASIIPPVAWFKDSFQVQVFTVNIVRSGKRSTSKDMKPWSITEIHQRLRERYWPEEIDK